MQSSPATIMYFNPAHGIRQPTKNQPVQLASLAARLRTKKRVDVQSGCRLTGRSPKKLKSTNGRTDKRRPSRQPCSSRLPITVRSRRVGAGSFSGPDGSSWLLSWSCMKLAYVSEPAKVVVGHDCFSFGVSLHAKPVRQFMCGQTWTEMVRWCYGRRGSAVLRSFHGCPFASCPWAAMWRATCEVASTSRATLATGRLFFGQGIEGYG